MKTSVSILASALFLSPLPAGADPVYRCLRDGKTVFSDEPVADSCTPMDLQIHPPSPEEVARIEEQKRLAAERDREEREQAARDRLMQAQTDAARAAERQAEAQRRLAEQQALESERQQAAEPYVILPGYSYPYIRPFPVPDHPLHPPDVPVRPPSGNYPYGADQVTVGGDRR
jgi:hypothetical protein